MRKPVTLIAGQFGSRHFGTRPYLEAAVKLTRKEAPLALYIGAASGDDETFGTALCGLIAAAGAIMLGERWIRWPRADASDAEAETYECLGIAPCALDTHGEGDDWAEARSFAAVRALELKGKAKAFGVPSGGALLARGGGKMLARGEPVPMFAAKPRHAATIERTLPAEKG